MKLIVVHYTGWAVMFNEETGQEVGRVRRNPQQQPNGRWQTWWKAGMQGKDLKPKFATKNDALRFLKEEAQRSRRPHELRT